MDFLVEFGYYYEVQSLVSFSLGDFEAAVLSVDLSVHVSVQGLPDIRVLVVGVFVLGLGIAVFFLDLTSQSAPEMDIRLLDQLVIEVREETMDWGMISDQGF